MTSTSLSTEAVSDDRLSELIEEHAGYQPYVKHNRVGSTLIMGELESMMRELQRLRERDAGVAFIMDESFGDGRSVASPPEPSAEHTEEVTGAADMLALFIEQLMDGPPNGSHMSLRQYLSQWRLVQGALDEYREARKGVAPIQTPRECRSCDQLMTERDNAEEQADKLADCVVGLLGIEIGEHSNMNEPWQNAIDAAEYEIDKRKRSSGEPSAELVRYGVDHNHGPHQPTHIPMEDGYWTPWHIADAALRAARLSAEPRAQYGLKEALEYLSERCQWLEKERRNGGDYKYLTLKLEECQYIARCISDTAQRINSLALTKREDHG